MNHLSEMWNTSADAVAAGLFAAAPSYARATRDVTLADTWQAEVGRVPADKSAVIIGVGTVVELPADGWSVTVDGQTWTFASHQFGLEGADASFRPCVAQIFEFLLPEAQMEHLIARGSWPISHGKTVHVDTDGVMTVEHPTA